MFTKFVPINNNILIETIEKDKTTAGGIIIPQEAQEKTQQGKVVHAGKSEQVSCGDRVYFKKYAGVTLDEKHIVLKEEDILGVL
jgi:chaperonin GroES